MTNKELRRRRICKLHTAIQEIMCGETSVWPQSRYLGIHLHCMHLHSEVLCSHSTSSPQSRTIDTQASIKRCEIQPGAPGDVFFTDSTHDLPSPRRGVLVAAALVVVADVCSAVALDWADTLAETVVGAVTVHVNMPAPYAYHWIKPTVSILPLT